MARGWWLAVVLGTVLTTGSAEAQTIGTFNWQLQPFCNIVSLTVSLSGPGYTLDGLTMSAASADALQSLVAPPSMWTAPSASASRSSLLREAPPCTLPRGSLSPR